MNSTKNLIALSFDIEDWFTVRNMREHLSFEDWNTQELRVDIGLGFILNELSKRKIKATFFILGWIAERCPHLVRKIDEDGHEICSHGFTHTPIDLLSPKSFEEDLNNSITALERIIGRRVRGYRAPSFSITQKTFWAIDVMKKAGIEYDSSIFRISHPDYGIPNFPEKITQIGGITEVPLRKGFFFGLKLPFSGGGYFRMFPYFFTKIIIKQTLKVDSFVMYFHPWEFDPKQPRIKLSFFKKFRHYVGLKSNRSKFISLLNDFEFTTISKWIEKECATKSTSEHLVSQKN